MSPKLTSIVIIPYTIHKEKQPFYLFGLLRSETLGFPTIELEEMEYNKEDIFRLTEDYLKTELCNYHDLVITYQADEQVETTLYLYYEISMNQLNSYTLTNSKIWFASIHEIINSRNIYNIPITEETTIYLKSRIDLFEDLFVPSIYYDGSHSKKIMFESLFGSPKVDGVFKFYDFFTAYDKAYTAGKNIGNSGAVLRYAVFTDDCSECTVEKYDDFVPLSLHDIPILTRKEYELL